MARVVRSSRPTRGSAASTIASCSGANHPYREGSPVGGQRGSHQRGVVATRLRQLGALADRLERGRVAGQGGGLAQTDEQLGAFGVGSLERGRVLQTPRANQTAASSGARSARREIARLGRPSLGLGEQPAELGVARQLWHELIGRRGVHREHRLVRLSVQPRSRPGPQLGLE